MGSFSSKGPNVSSKAVENTVVAEIESDIETENVTIRDEIETNNFPIAQTPLTKTIATHFNRMAQNGLNNDPSIATPSYFLRKKILHDLGYTYTMGEVSLFDPRSPSSRIPRTPLNLTEETVVPESELAQCEDSFEEKSCRAFNEKLANITLDDCDENEISKDVEVEYEQYNSSSSDVSTEKPLIKTKSEANAQSFAETTEKMKCNDEEIGAIEKEKVDLNESTEETVHATRPIDYATPSKPQQLDTGRIPLSIVNRRGPANEQTPYSFKKYTDCKENFEQSPSLFDESINKSLRPKGSSKIPVYSKK